MTTRIFPPTFYDRLFTFHSVKIFYRHIDNNPLNAFWPLDCEPAFLCAASFRLGRFLLANSSSPHQIHIIIPPSEWLKLALNRLCEWTRTEKITTAYTDPDGTVKNITYAALWEIGRKFEAPRYQNAVVKAFLWDWEVDPEKALELSGFEWLCERHRGLVEEGGMTMGDHRFLWFLARMVMWKAPSRYWTEVVQRQAFTGLKLAGWMQEKFREEGNVWMVDPRVGMDCVEWVVKEDVDVEDGVGELDALKGLRINDD
ncbi:hypothetical protein HYALB_00010297 [Hymenoscyphus albidus]|uniref:Uncharacterized protein n=1 Tax=Hymenoscyphus albidus TaxID=595503 RepID=A0A9N9PXB0_9HELO|nr:hypothetical protein HYALB_00010297 [Hymenoscyphus albidus]